MNRRQSITELIIIHLPRTAGSSLHAHLGGQLSGSSISLETGHYFWDDLEPKDGRLFFTVLREPVARSKSLIRFIMDDPSHRKHERLIEMGPAAWLDFAGPISQFSNGQTRHFVGSGALGRTTNENDLIVAKKNIDREDVIACTLPELSFGLRLLSDRLRYPINRMEHRINASNPKPLVGDVDAKLQRLNHLDSALFEYVSQNLKRQKRWYFVNRVISFKI